MSLKDDILATITRLKTGVTFIELMRLEGAAGDCRMSLKPNLVLWDGMSLEFSEAISSLILSGEIEANSTSPFFYVIDGGMLNIPVAKSIREYKDPHWLPTVFSIKNSGR